MDQPRPWHLFRDYGWPLRRTTCCLIFISIVTTLPILLWHEYFNQPPPSPTSNPTSTPNSTPSLTSGTPSTYPPSRRRRTADLPTGASQCHINHAHRSFIQVCFPINSYATISVPLTGLSFKGHRAIDYAGYPWYMTNDQLHTSWSTLVADPPGYDWSSYTATNWALHQRPLFHLIPSGLSLLITVNLTKTSLIPSDMSGDGQQSDCWLFYLRTYVRGTDAPFPIILCQEPIQVTSKPTLSTTSVSLGVSVISNLTTDDYFDLTTGISGHSNNWLLLAEATGDTTKSDCIVCLGPRPLLKVVPTPLELNFTCLIQLMTQDNLDSLCSSWDLPFPVGPKTDVPPVFDAEVARNNFTCFVNHSPGNIHVGTVNISYCVSTHNLSHSPKVDRSDIWWWCGGKTLRPTLPKNWSGICTPSTLILPVTVFPVAASEVPVSFSNAHSRLTRRSLFSLESPDTTYIDAIGIPRGVPDEYKLVNQIAAGFESILIWITPNKNVDRINYIHYNVQRLSNFTRDGFEAVHEQLKATSLMAFQNRIAVDMLLAEKGGVCSIFGDQCCTFIPNNTAPLGKLTRAVDGLRTLSAKLNEHSGIDTSMWDNMFGKYKNLAISICMALAVFSSVLILCGCCCIPCLRALLVRLIDTAIGQKVPLLLYSRLPQQDSKPQNPNNDDVNFGQLYFESSSSEEETDASI
uniref:Uncharacterized protein n=1 Tax=Denticeps clupeoides TaxID=299321 RepID=A0AAY4E1F4_9TELE